MQTILSTNKYLLNYSRKELCEFVISLGMENYRGEQIFKGIYCQLFPDFLSLTTLTKKNRTLLVNNAHIRQFHLINTTKSDKDNTTKFLWELADGKKIESVIIYEGKRVTFCLSTQVGCALDCKFCATGKMGFLRNLTSGEIIEQVLLMKKLAVIPPTNIVFMGMGEPLLNLNNVLKASEIISDPDGLAFSRKKITISTVGVIPGIRKLTELNSPYSLAISLNAVFEDKRQKIMPVSKKYPIEKLIEEVGKYISKTGKRITFEYILIKNVNDSKKDADQLLKLTHRLPCKINIISCNSNDPEFQPSSEKTTNWFCNYIHDNNRTSTIRLRKGEDIRAACGQLYYMHEDDVGEKMVTGN